MEHNIHNLPEKVKRILLTAFDAVANKRILPGLKRPVDPRGAALSHWKVSEEEQREVDRQMTEVRKQYEGTPQWLKTPNGEVSLLVQAARDLGLPEEELWLKVRTPLFSAWFGEWEKVARRTAGAVTEDSAPVTSALSPASRVSRPYGEYTPKSEKSQEGLLDKNGEPLAVFHGTPSRFDKKKAVGVLFLSSSPFFMGHL